MLIGAYGRFWNREHVDWGGRSRPGWRLLGRQNINKGSLKVTDFRLARGVYILYDDVGTYYVGLAGGKNGIGGRLKDHLTDEHGHGWTRFSWFSFDEPNSTRDEHGVFSTTALMSAEIDSAIVIRDLEALLQVALSPYANLRQARFSNAQEWLQVPTVQPQVQTFEELRRRLS